MTANVAQPQDTSSSDRIEKNLVVRAPRSRVWRAIADSKEFGTWFRMNVDGEFTEGARLRGRMTHPGYEHVSVELQIQNVEPERYFSYRWHPYALDMSHDYSAEPMTLVEFILEDAGEGTSITIIESGFDRIPPSRRAESFRMNEKGWGGQIRNLEKHVA